MTVFDLPGILLRSSWN